MSIPEENLIEATQETLVPKSEMELLIEAAEQELENTKNGEKKKKKTVKIKEDPEKPTKKPKAAKATKPEPPIPEVVPKEKLPGIDYELKTAPGPIFDTRTGKIIDHSLPEPKKPSQKRDESKKSLEDEFKSVFEEAAKQSPSEEKKVSPEKLTEAIKEIEIALSKLDKQDIRYGLFEDSLKSFQAFPNPSENDRRKWKEYDFKKGSVYRQVHAINATAPEEWMKGHEFKPEPTKIETKHYVAGIKPSPAPEVIPKKTYRELFLERWESKLPQIEDAVAKMQAFIPQLPELAGPSHISVKFLLDQQSASFERIINEIKGEKNAIKLSSRDLDIWNEYEKDTKGEGRLRKTLVKLENATKNKIVAAERNSFIEEWTKKIPLIRELESKIKAVDPAALAALIGQTKDEAKDRLSYYEEAIGRVVKGIEQKKLQKDFSHQDLDFVTQFETGKGRLPAMFKQLEEMSKPETEAVKAELEKALGIIDTLVSTPGINQNKYAEYTAAIVRMLDFATHQKKGEEPSAEDLKKWDEFVAEGHLEEKIPAAPETSEIESYFRREREALVTDEERVEMKAKLEQALGIANQDMYTAAIARILDCVTHPETGSQPLVEDLKKWNEFISEPIPEPIAPPRSGPMPSFTAPPSPKEYAPVVEGKLFDLDLTVEMLKTIPEFKDIEDSDEKVAWMLQKFQEVKVRTLRNEATEAFEKELREKRAENGLLKTFAMKRGRKGLIEAKAQELARTDLDFNKYKGDISSLIHLANAAPEMFFIEKEGGTQIVTEYVDGVFGVDQNQFNMFNAAASAYANIPPEYEWSKFSKSEEAGFEKIKVAYEKEADTLLKVIPEHFKKAENGKHSEKYTGVDAQLLVNAAETSVKLHQNLNRYPSAELELKKLAESEGWSRKWEVIKAQMGIAGAGAGTGGMLGFAAGSAALRWGVKSSLVMTGAAVALPAAALGLGVLIGWKKGGMNAEEQLRKEEELMRLGFEEQTGSRKKLPALDAKIKERRDLKSYLEMEARVGDEKKKAKIKERLEVIDKEIIKLRESKQGTDKNFVNADDLGSKIAHLQKIIGMDFVEYDAYVRNLGDKTLAPRVDFNGFEEKKKEWAEKLEVRLAYAKQKLDEGKISFGSEGALASQLHLFQKMGKAYAELAVLPRYFEMKKFIGKDTGKVSTKEARLKSVLDRREEKINTNRDNFVRREQRKGVLTGLLMGGAGFAVGHLASEYVSGFIHDVEEGVRELKAVDLQKGKAFEMVVKDTVKTEIAHVETSNLIQASMPTPPSVPDAIVNLEPEPVSSSFVEVSQPQPEVLAPKPFETILTNETQSRESTLIKYYQSKGMSRGEAGSAAHRYMMENYGPKGERAAGFVHKGDKISIIEKDGKVDIKVERAGKSIQIKKPNSILDLPTEEPLPFFDPNEPLPSTAAFEKSLTEFKK